jgi:hypothetical protein
MQASAGTAAALAMPSIVRASAPAGEKPEELVKRLWGTLTARQKAAVCFGWDHPNRQKVSNNWKIVEPEIGTFYTADQQRLIRDIFLGLTNPDWKERWDKQQKDDSGGFDKYVMAIFGDPSTDRYEWVMTGRHCTIRCDGDSEPGAAFGGPIFYGHAADSGFNETADHPGNVFWHQGKLANKVFQALDGRQRETALVLKGSPGDEEKSIRLRKEGEFEGISVAGLPKDVKALVEDCLRELLAPYRASDVEEALKLVKDGGGVDALRMVYYKDGDIGDDGVWDRWMVQGPTLSWYFRGSPHVHTWVKVAQKA